MKFLFSSSTRHLTRSLRSLVSYRVKHSKRNSISTRAIYYSLYMVIGPNLFRLSRTRIHDFVETETTRFRGNDQSGKIWTRQEPIRMPGFTSELPCHKMNKLVIVLTRAAPALEYHFLLFFFFSWACCLQLCNFSVMLLRNCGSILWF